MWLVGFNRPYYPEIKTFEDEAEARKCYNEFLKEHEEDGDIDSEVFITRIVESKKIKTYN